MFGLSKKEKEEKWRHELARFDRGEIAFDQLDKHLRLRIERKKSDDRNDYSGLRCPDCYAWSDMTQIRCVKCDKAFGDEGFNSVEGESFYLCKTCNTRFVTKDEYKDHQYKHG